LLLLKYCAYKIKLRFPLLVEINRLAILALRYKIGVACEGQKDYTCNDQTSRHQTGFRKIANG
jgi:hypothetical protein